MSLQPFLDFGARQGYRLGDRAAVDGTLPCDRPLGPLPDGRDRRASRRAVPGLSRRPGRLRVPQPDSAKEAVRLGTLRRRDRPRRGHERRATRMFTADEHPRPDTTREKLGQLKPAFASGGTVTAGNSSGINDARRRRGRDDESVARARGLRPWACCWPWPRERPSRRSWATRRHRDRPRADQAGDERRRHGRDRAERGIRRAVRRGDQGRRAGPEGVNPHGGAIALGHPVGATGAILTLKAAVRPQAHAAASWAWSPCASVAARALAAVYQACE